jgi:hypothetical protein
MTSPTASRAGLPTTPAPTWDWQSVRFDRSRVVALVALVALVAFAGALAARGGLAGVLAALVTTDIVVMCLPWRVPRAGRTMRSIVLENLTYQVMPLGALVAVVSAGPSWLTRTGSWWWYSIALLTGAALVAVSGVSLSMLFSGELAFLAGPRPAAHVRAHVAAALAGPPGEEAVFRCVVFLTYGIGAVVTPALAAVAFVARHHLPPRSAGQIRLRALGTEVAAASLLLGLTVASRSLYPAAVAHLVNNVPQAVLEIQRGRIGGKH